MSTDLTINVNANTAPLEGSLKQMRQEIKTLSGQLGSGLLSQQDQQAITTRIAQLKGKVQDLSASVTKFDPGDTFGNFATIMGVANTALVGVTNSLSLFGVEENKVKAIQDKLNKLIQIGVVLQQLADSSRLKGMITHYAWKVKEFVINNLLIKQKKDELGATIALTAAQRALNAAIIASGIGALIAGLALLVSWLVSSASGTDDLTDSTKELNDSFVENSKKIEELKIDYQVLTGEISNLEGEIRKLNIAFTEETKKIDETTDELLSNAAKRYLTWYSSITDFFSMLFGGKTSIQKYAEESNRIIEKANEARAAAEEKRELQKQTLIKENAIKTAKEIAAEREKIRIEENKKEFDTTVKLLDAVKTQRSISNENLLLELEILGKINTEGLSDVEILENNIRLEERRVEILRSRLGLNVEDNKKVESILRSTKNLTEEQKKQLGIQNTLPNLTEKQLLLTSNIFSMYDKINKVQFKETTALQEVFKNFQSGIKMTEGYVEAAFEAFKKQAVETNSEFGMVVDGVLVLSKEGEDTFSVIQQGLYAMAQLSTNLGSTGYNSLLKYINEIKNLDIELIDLKKQLSELTISDFVDALTKQIQKQENLWELQVLYYDRIKTKRKEDRKNLQKEAKLRYENEKLFIDQIYQAKLQAIGISDDEKQQLVAEWALALELLGIKVKNDLEDKIGKPLKDQFKELESEMIKTFGDVPLSAMQIWADRASNNFDVLINQLDEAYDKQIEGIDKLKEYQIAAGMDSAVAEQEALDKKEAAKKAYDERVRKAKIKNFQFEKRMALYEIAINTAVAVTSALRSTSPTRIADAIFAGVQGALQASIVAAKPMPVFAKGGILQGPTHANGGILTPYGEVEGGEFIVNRRQTNNNEALLTSINNSNGDMIKELSIRLDQIVRNTSSPSRSYVVEADITKNQKEVSNIKRRAYV